MFYKFPSDKDIYEPLSTDGRPESNSPSNDPRPIKCSPLTEIQANLLGKAMALLFSEGDDLILQSIEDIKKLMIENFQAVFKSKEFANKKIDLPNRFIELLKKMTFVCPTLELLAILLEKSGEFDYILTSKGIANILTNILNALLSKCFDENDTIYSLGNLFSVSKSLSNPYSIPESSFPGRFCHELFENNFYEQIPKIFHQKLIDPNGESVNDKIASLLYITSINKSLSLNEMRCLLKMIPMLLENDDPAIVRVGFKILSKLSIQLDDVELLLKDGQIISNLCRFISKESSIDFVIETIVNLSRFANIGGKVIDMMNSFDCLQNIFSIFDVQNDQLVNSVFDLSIKWLIHQNNSLVNMFILLKSINFIYIFNNSNFNIKEKALRVLKLASFLDSPENKIIDVVNLDLFKTIISQFSVGDDPNFSYEGCLLMHTMIYKLSGPQFRNQLKSCLLNEDFCNKIDYMIWNEPNEIASKAKEIMTFIQEISTE